VNFKSILSTVILVLKKHTAIDLSKKIDVNNSIPYIEALTYPVIGLLMGFILFLISFLRLLYSPLFVAFITLCTYFLITKGKNFKPFALTIQQILNSKIFKNNEDSNIEENFIHIILIMGYFILFAVSKASALLIAPIIAYIVPCTVSLLLTLNFKNCSMISAFSQNKAFSYGAFIISFAIPILVHTNFAISVAIIYVLLMYFIKYLNIKLECLPENFEHILIESILIIFLILSYLLFL